MDRLICDMLKYSSLLQSEVSLQPVKVSDVLGRLIAENPVFQDHAGDIAISPHLPAVCASEPLLFQCFSALLDNAIRYARPGVAAKIAIRGKIQSGWAVISMEDNGAGMSAEFQNRAFGLFEKGTGRSEGAGIGLALARVAIERMGGQVGVRSEEGKGSCFWIQLKPATGPEIS
jgi:signal transduction histidine kinase